MGALFLISQRAPIQVSTTYGYSNLHSQQQGSMLPLFLYPLQHLSIISVTIAILIGVR